MHVYKNAKNSTQWHVSARHNSVTRGIVCVHVPTEHRRLTADVFLLKFTWKTGWMDSGADWFSGWQGLTPPRGNRRKPPASEVLRSVHSTRCHELNWPATSRPSYTTRALVTRVSVATWLAAAKLGRSVLGYFSAHAFQRGCSHRSPVQIVCCEQAFRQETGGEFKVGVTSLVSRLSVCLTEANWWRLIAEWNRLEAERTEGNQSWSAISEST